METLPVIDQTKDHLNHDVMVGSIPAEYPIVTIWRSVLHCVTCDETIDLEFNKVRHFFWWLLDGNSHWSGSIHLNNITYRVVPVGEYFND